MKSLILAAAIALALASPAAAQTRGFDPRTYQRQHIGEPTQILVLGSLHLSETPDGFDPQVLEALLARLAAFRPDAIAIEDLPGKSIAQFWQYREIYPEVARRFGGRAMTLAALARGATDLDMPDAEAEVRRTLADWPASPTPAQRRRLAALFAAAGDPQSALVQWWRLDPVERIADEHVPRRLVDEFAALDGSARRDEASLIASRLAARIGLERVHPMDDMNEDISEEFLTDYLAFWSEYTAAFDADPRSARIREPDRLASAAEALETYRWLNTRATGRLYADLQWLSMINRPTANDVGRRRVAAWEARNLRMAGNIRDVAALAPGGRVLVIVGAAHKPWLDAYLGMMSDVRIVDATAVLR